MSEDELFAFFLSLAVSVVCGWKWFRPAATVRSERALRWLVWLLPFFSAALLFSVLRTLASHDVRNDPRYLLFYMALGAAWVGLAILLTPLTDLHVRDDVLERRNSSAAATACGMVLGLTLAFAGGNIGDGPGWWVVVFSAALSTGTLLTTWWVIARSGLAEKITVERDVRAGVRAAAWLIAVGMVTGRAVAGNWTSVEATVNDFARMGWPALLLMMVAGAAEGVRAIDRGTGWIPTVGLSVAYLTFSTAWLAFLGRPA